jgi:hypothetical protein
MVVISSRQEGWTPPPGEPSPMPYERVPRSAATRWTTLLGVALALIAAGSFIAFSLVARDATSAGLDVPVAAIAPVASAPALTFSEREGRTDRTGDDGVRLSSDGRDLVLGTRFANGPVSSGSTSPGGETSGDRCKSRCNGGTKDRNTMTSSPMVPTRAPEGTDYEGESKSKPQSSGPSPKGKAKGHEKAKGQGHNKHPGDH